MNALQQIWSRHLWSHYVAHAEYMRHLPKAVGVVGAIAFPLFYALHELRGTKGYDSAWLRGTAALLCLGLALRDHWPQRFRSWYVPWSYFTYLFCLPFLMVFLALKNGGGSVAVANTFMGVFFLVLLTDWRNTVVMMVVGAGAATLAYIATTSQPAMPVEYLGRLPTLILVIVGGNAFKLSEKQIQAERLDAATVLAGTIAHEMRNPLGQLRHSLAGIQRTLPGPGAHGRPSPLASDQVDKLYVQLAKGEQAIDRGLQVITMTLDALSAKPLDAAEFDLLSAADVVRKAVDEYGYDSDAARESVRVDVRQDFLFRGDETAYLFVLFNLIKNALYYLGPYPGTRVTLTIGDHRVTVHDNGPGIEPDVLPTLFEPFRSVGKSGGTGLGLAYCQRVMKAFGGSIRCQSQPGAFTEFILQFPEVSEPARKEHHAQALEQARQALAGKRLLMVEDDATQRAVNRHKLRPVGLVIDEAADGMRALDLLARHPYDLVLLDLNMPVLDGYQVAHRLRQGQSAANRYVRIVAHTSEPAHTARGKTQRAGMDGFVAKPCAQLPLVQALVAALQRPGAEVAAHALTGRRVLLADDSAYNRRAVAAYLREAGAEVVEVDHGRAVLQALAGETGFHAVLLDLGMPGMGGLETTRAVRASRQPWAGVPIVALTAHSDAPAVQGAREAGMDGFLVKPVEAMQLYEALGAVLAGDAPQSQPSQPGLAICASGDDMPLLNEARLQSYCRLGLLDELLADYLPEIARLVGELGQSVQAQDLARAQEALHSLLGMSGEAGALALYQLVRRVYVPVLEERRWPADAHWLEQVQELAARTEQALRNYGARQQHSQPT